MRGKVCQANYRMDDTAEEWSSPTQRLQSVIDSLLCFPPPPTQAVCAVSYLDVQDSITLETGALFVEAAAAVLNSKPLRFIVQHAEQRNTLAHARCSAHKVIGI